MTTHQPWTWLEPGGRPTIEQVIEKKLNGSLPFVPPKFNATNKTGILALYYATISCFAYNPHDRPTSYQLSHALRIALDWAKENKPVPREEVENLFHFHHKPRTKFSIENEIERRAKLLEESSSKVTVHLQHQANATTNNHKKHRPTMDPELFSNKTKELLKEKNRQIQAAEARRRLIERRKAVPRPKIALRVH